MRLPRLHMWPPSPPAAATAVARPPACGSACCCRGRHCHHLRLGSKHTGGNFQCAPQLVRSMASTCFRRSATCNAAVNCRRYNDRVPCCPPPPSSTPRRQPQAAPQTGRFSAAGPGGEHESFDPALLLTPRPSMSNLAAAGGGSLSHTPSMVSGWPGQARPGCLGLQYLCVCFSSSGGPVACWQGIPAHCRAPPQPPGCLSVSPHLPVSACPPARALPACSCSPLGAASTPRATPLAQPPNLWAVT